MAIGNATKLGMAGEAPSAPVFMDTLSMPGDDAYAAGGSLGFAAYVAAQLGLESVSMIAVLDGAHSDPARRLVYDPATDALKVLDGNAELAAGDDSATTYQVVVVYQ